MEDGGRPVEFVELEPGAIGIGHDGASADPSRIEPTVVGIDEGGAARHIGESEGHAASGLSGASQGIDGRDPVGQVLRLVIAVQVPRGRHECRIGPAAHQHPALLVRRS